MFAFKRDDYFCGIRYFHTFGCIIGQSGVSPATYLLPRNSSLRSDPIIFLTSLMRNEMKQRDFLDPLTWPSMFYLETSRHMKSSPKNGIYAIAGWTFDEYYDKKPPTIYYIGSSTDIARRLHCHPRENDLLHLYSIVKYYYETPWHTLGEKLLIKLFRPPLNKQHNG